MEILGLLVDRANEHFQKNSKNTGFLISYQDFLALNYL